MDWNPRRYEKFTAAREAPAVELMTLIRPEPSLRAVDLGCGPGNITVKLAAALPEAEIIGLDSSPSMLQSAAPLASERLRFGQATIEEFADGGGLDGSFDLIFSNAALHWVPDHAALIPKLIARLSPRGQLAVQLPADDYNSARTIFSDVAGWRYEMATLDIGAYAQLLYSGGLGEQSVYEKIFPHILADADAMLEWARGTALLPYLERLPPAQRDPYLEEVRRRLQARYPERPVFFPFRRILFYGRRA